MRASRVTPGLLSKFVRAESGATAIEYALIAFGLSIVISAAVFGVGSNLKTNYYERIKEATTN